MAPTDGRLTSQPLFTGSLTGSEFIMLVSPGNAATGINYKMTASALASFIMPSGGTALPLVSNGPTANPIFQLLTVPGGGLGTATLGTGVLIGQGTTALITVSPLSVSTGGIGTTSLATNAVVIGEGTGALITQAAGTNQILAANNGTPVFTPAPQIGTSLTVFGSTLITLAGTTPGGLLSDSGIRFAGADGSAARLEMDSFGAQPVVTGLRANGTSGGITPVINTNPTFVFGGGGYNGAVYTTSGVAQFFAIENWNATSVGSAFRIFTVPAGSTVNIEAMRVQGSGGVSLGTTTDPGIGSIEATGDEILRSGTGLTTTGTAVLLFSSVANFGIFMGTGVPTGNVVAGTGSLLFRNDGNSATTRMYINQNGGSTWTGITTQA